MQKASQPWRLADQVELLSFPAGKHDDQVDALSLVGQLLDTMVPSTLPKPEEAPPPGRWDQAFARAEARDGASWKAV